MRVGDAFTWWYLVAEIPLMLGFLWVLVAGPSAGDAVTELMKMLVAAVSCLETFTNCNRQSTALLQALDIHLKVMLSVANSRDLQFTFLLVFFPLRIFLRVCDHCTL